MPAVDGPASRTSVYARGTLVLFAVLGLLALAAAAGRPVASQSVSVSVGPHVRVVCDFADDELSNAALATAERAWGRTATLLRVESPPPPVTQRVIYVFRSTSAWRRSTEPLKNRLSDRVTDFEGLTDWEANVAYVLLPPNASRTVWSGAGRPDWILRAVAHEASHLAMAEYVPEFGFVPDWLAEGMATLVEDQVALSKNDFRAEEARRVDPETHRRMLVLQRLSKCERLPHAGNVLLGSIDDLSISDRYAVFGEYFRLLSEPPYGRRFSAVVESLNGAGGDWSKRVSDVVRRTWSAEEIDEVDVKFRRRIDALAPLWDVVSGRFGVDGDSTLGMAHAGEVAIMWRLGSTFEPNCSVEGALTILSGGVSEAGVAFGRSKSGFVAVGFCPGVGVSVREWRADGDEWRLLGVGRTTDLRVLTELAFRVVWMDDELRVSVNDALVVVVPTSGLTVDGEWGLVMDRGGSAVWRGLRQESQ